MWYMLAVAPRDDSSSAIKTEGGDQALFFTAISFPAVASGSMASMVARLQEARHHSQGLAEHGYFLFQYVRLMAAYFSRLSIRNHKGIRSGVAKILAALLRQRRACTLYPGDDGHLSSTWYS